MQSLHRSMPQGAGKGLQVDEEREVGVNTRHESVLFRAARLSAYVTAAIVIAQILILRIGQQDESSDVAVLPTARPTLEEMAFSILSVVMLFAVISAVVTAIMWAKRGRRGGS